MFDFFKTKKFFLIISAFVILYFSTSFYSKNFLNESVNILIASFFVLILAIKNWPIKFSLSHFFICALFCLLSFTTSFLSDDEAKLMVYSILVMLLAFLFTSSVPFTDFKEVFVKIMIFVCVISICIYVIHVYMPNILSIFPTLSRHDGFTVYNMFFCIEPVYNKFIRASGFFWEPGAFQTFINLAIIFVFFENEKNRMYKLIVLYTALILTFSVTGWIVGFINLFVLVFMRYEKSGRSFFYLLFLPILLLGIFLVLKYSPDNIEGVTFGAAKLDSFMEGPSHGSYNSSSVRYDSIFYAVKLFLEAPILGSGFNGISAMTQNMYHNMLTCTPLNYFAMYGFFYGCLVGLCVFQIARFLTSFKNEKLAFLIFISFFVSTISEHYVNYLIMDIFIMYGALFLKNSFFDETSFNNEF